ncbi:peptidase M24, structural domain-containing protein [Lasiosphaeris hirsuta]|uniref:Xaa-Pro aminopeptidase n=1 Tax=Lasiosphaeris hirsuta TaxID=260670 RepID=A0AA40A2U1_9PEZI|nr:peptidase M24, structural domain-containing protein [Lasiosphaeris hirsuta]
MSFPRAAVRHLERHVARQHIQGTLRTAQLGAALCRATASQASWRPSPRAGRSYATVSAIELEFGQPVHETHPHILKAGEITPGITAQEYADRRTKLAHSLANGGIAVLAAADLKYRSGAVFFPFRQESNFLYLTGFLEPGALAVIQKTGPDLGDYEFHLFCRPKDPRAEQWSGPWSGLQAATDVFNADSAHDIAKADTLLPNLLQSATRIYADLPSPNATVAPSLPNTIRHALPKPNVLATLQPLVNSLRAIKSPAEVAAMRHAGRVSGRALTDAMRRPWAYEKDLHSFLTHAFSQDGCGGEAYVPVVAGGPRGTMIHYVHNTAALAPGSTVLVDAGGEYGNYVSDITRTWPVSGRFSAPQRDLYEAVLRVQRRVVTMCRADAALTLDQLHRVADNGLREELTALGFQGLAAGDGGGMDVLFPHHVGHYVGLDVHDVPGYGRGIQLKTGHCVTVEPGIYVPDDERFPKHFRGLAVRIEDSVCVNDDGPIVLTAEAVKEVVDIEALRDY